MALASSIRAIMPLQPALLPAVNQENLADLLRGNPGLNVSIMRAVSRSERLVTRCQYRSRAYRHRIDDHQL
jgi:hypothetical protein